ncbi:MAG TPA: VOC family protein [Nitrososphaerales archaeon]|nr:VOC family protein [Nitrososphaerales archaeon]
MRLANVIILVSDLDRAERFYRDTLGLKETGRVEREFVFFDAGGVALAIRATGRVAVPGDTELSFEVPDVLSAYDSLRSRVAFSEAPRAVTGDETQDLYAANFTDPDGHSLSITGWVPKAGR